MGLKRANPVLNRPATPHTLQCLVPRCLEGRGAHLRDRSAGCLTSVLDAFLPSLPQLPQGLQRLAGVPWFDTQLAP